MEGGFYEVDQSIDGCGIRCRECGLLLTLPCNLIGKVPFKDKDMKRMSLDRVSEYVGGEVVDSIG